MNLKETLEMPINTPYQMEVMIVQAELRDKKAGGKYLSLTVQDMSATLSLNMWANYGDVSNYVQGSVALISGAVGKPYQDKPQLNLDYVQVIAGSLLEYTGDKVFMPSYDITNDHVSHIVDTIDILSEPYRSLAQHILLDDERWDKFKTCPAAKKHHGAKRGGLILHTIGVVETIKGIRATYLPSLIIPFDTTGTINWDMLIFMGLVHDIGKINEYVWESVIDYRKENLVEHKFMAVYYVVTANASIANPLPETELQKVLYSLLSHHGAFGGTEIQPKSAEDWILHLADMIDSRIVGAVEGV